MKNRAGAWILVLSVLVFAVAGVCSIAAEPEFAGAKDFSAQVGHAAKFAISPPLRDIKIPPVAPPADEPREAFPVQPLGKGVAQNQAPQGVDPDLALQYWPGYPDMPAPLTGWDGVTNVNGVYPPDTNGDVGPNHFVQWVNLSLAIWNKSGTLLIGPVNGNTIWTSLGGVCSTSNDGDPIVLYDRLADRWMISQFALPNYPSGPYYQAIAVSQTPDPTGAWYLYCFAVSATKMNDYPHFGVWPDGYYMTCNQFTGGSSWGGAGVWVFDRTKMLAGDPTATFQYFDLGPVNLNFGGQLPSHYEGTLAMAPAAGTPNYIMEFDDSTWIGPNDALRVWQFHVDWVTPANSTLGLSGQPNQIIDTAPFNLLPCTTGGTRTCIPQPGTAQKVDAIGDRLMYRVQYRNWGTHEGIVANHTVWADGTDRAGMRWYELRKTAGSWSIFQQGTYAPADTEYRWMGSVAMDHMGDLAAGYSVSSGTVYPSIRYAGRLSGDPLGTLAQAETEMKTGSGSQTGSGARWGDYSSMSVDPTDDCTFWYTQEYVQVTGTASWKTWIGSFKFPSCTIGPTGTLNGTVTNSATSAPLVGATVQATDGVITQQTLSGAGGVYTMTLPVSTYTVSASNYGFLPQSVSGAAVTDGGTTTRNFALSPAPSHTISGVVSDATTGWPLYASLSITGYPLGTIWNDPVTGAYSVSLVEAASYTFYVSAWVPGYGTATWPLTVPAGNVSHNFALTADPGPCSAPGYLSVGGISQPFSTGTLPSGWTVVDNIGNGQVWAFNNPGSRANTTGGTGGFAIVDSDFLGSGGTQNTELRSPVLDFTGVASVPMSFKTDYNNLGDTADVDVSVNGAAGPWTNVWRQTVDFPGPATVNLDLTALAANQANVMVRFHYYNAAWAWWWEVDDVVIGTPTCTAPATGGLVVGNAYDANSPNPPMAGVTVSHDAGGSTTTAATVDIAVPDSFYTLYCPVGTHSFTAAKTGFGPDIQSVAVTSGGTVRQDFQLKSGRLTVSPTSLSVEMLTGMTTVRDLTLNNVGTLSATFEVKELPGGMTPLGPFQQPDSIVKPFKQGLRDTRTLDLPDPPPAAPYAAGAVFQSWVPTGTAGPWGISVDSRDDTVWVGSPSAGWGGNLTMHEYSRAGVSTGRAWPFTWAPANGPADFAWDNTNGTIWVMNIDSGISNCIYEMDPAGGYTGRTICPGGGAGFATSQRGLAYDPSTDTFYAGGWNDLTVYHFTATGTILSQVNVGLSIAGLAYNATTQHLFVMVNDAPNPVFVLDAANNYAVLGQFSITGFGDYSGAGIDMDCDGHLWAVEQGGGRVYEVDSGETSSMCVTDVPWVSESPTTGSVSAPGSQPVQVTFTSMALATPGVYTAQLKVDENTPNTVPNVPLTLTVMRPLAATAGANVLTGTAPLLVSFSGAATYGTGPYTYDWNFGDLSPHSNAQNANHRFSTPGTYNVTLQVQDSGWPGHNPPLPVQTATDTNLTIIVTSGLVERVPYSVKPLKITTSNQGADGTVTWDVDNCPSANYHIVYGMGSGLSAWTVSGGKCGMGYTGSYIWSAIPNPSADSKRFLWFLVVGDDGAAAEGSWGQTSSGTERGPGGGATPSGVCGINTKVTASTCGTSPPKAPPGD